MDPHQLVENGRLNIRQHDAVQKFHDAAFYQDPPVNLGVMVLLLVAGQHVQDHHLVGLFV
jgi:hypothetical protein